MTHTLQHLRLRLAMTQAELAAASGLSPAVIWSAERGEKIPRASSLRKLAAALDVDTRDLWDAIMASKEAADGVS